MEDSGIGVTALSTVLGVILMMSVSAPIDAMGQYEKVARDIVEQHKGDLEGRKAISGGDLSVPGTDSTVYEYAKSVIEAADKARDEAISGVQRNYGINPDPVSEKPDAMPYRWVDILVSRSMGEPAIKQIMAQAAGSTVPVRMVFRGIPTGTKINDTFADFARWSRGIDSPPGAALDPTVFQDVGATTVPMMVYMEKGEAVAQVSGLTNAGWLHERVSRGETGDLGVQGPVEEIGERDLIEVMKEKAAQIDFVAQKQRTIDTYWERAKFTPLKPAVEYRRRDVDPSIVVNQDITDHDGKVVVPAGTKVNPMALQPFSIRLIVFNPTREGEIQWASVMKPDPGVKDIYLMTEMDREGGWDSFNALQDRLGQPVYLLQLDMRKRFHLERSPSLVTSGTDTLIVEEFAIGRSRPEAPQNPSTTLRTTQ